MNNQLLNIFKPNKKNLNRNNFFNKATGNAEKRYRSDFFQGEIEQRGQNNSAKIQLWHLFDCSNMSWGILVKKFSLMCPTTILKTANVKFPKKPLFIQTAGQKNRLFGLASNSSWCHWLIVILVSMKLAQYGNNNSSIAEVNTGAAIVPCGWNEHQMTRKWTCHRFIFCAITVDCCHGDAKTPNKNTSEELFCREVLYFP